MPLDTWAALRQIMYQPSAVWLATEYSGDRWLTDQFVMINVTGMDFLSYYDFHVCLGYDVLLGYEPAEGECSCPDQVPDGPYKLTINKGVSPRDSVPEPDVEAYFTAVNHRDWVTAKPTEWSVAEHPGKAMLWDSGGTPALMGESTWTAIKRHYPEVRVSHSFRGNSVFRFLDNGTTFAFAAGIGVPDGQQDVAEAIVEAA